MNEMILTSEEIYYLGTIMQADHIDYSYVAEMKEIESRMSLFEKETQAMLSSKGILVEDFSGNVQLDKTAESLLKPIYFGETEFGLEIAVLGEKPSMTSHHFHVMDGLTTYVLHAEENLTIQSADSGSIKNMVDELVDESYSVPEKIFLEKLEEDKVTRLISAKHVTIGEKSTVDVYVEIEGVVYKENDNVKLESMTAEELKEAVLSAMKGE